MKYCEKITKENSLTSRRARANMADAAHQASVTVVQVDNELTGHMLGVTSDAVAEDDEVCEDILQQALVEASECFDENTVVYTTQGDNCVATVADGSGVQIPLTVTETGDVVNNVQTVVNGATYAYVDEMHCSDGNQTINDTLQPTSITIASPNQVTIPEQEEELAHIAIPIAPCNGTVPDGEVDQPVTSEPTLVQSQLCNIVGNEGGNLQTILPASTMSMTVVTNGSQATAPPLGSSTNPIRIVQQGSQYTSVQQLTTTQLEHIMQVVQEQHVAKSTAQVGGSSVLFNPDTQTRIVYRVIYPSELHAKSLNTVGSATTLQGNQLRVSVPTDSVMIQQLKRTYRKRKHDDDEKIDGPDLSKEEKEARKKHRPRTRSGRVSRPPKHMVQDYKHIHPVDWDEDYDDSDGGYSDFRQSDEESADKHESPYTNYVPMTTGKPKNWKCDKCPKAYIGRAGLARHFRMRPSHGRLLQDPSGVVDEEAEDSSRDSKDADSVDGAAITCIATSAATTIASSSESTTTDLTSAAVSTAITGSESVTSVPSAVTPQPKGVLKVRQQNSDSLPVKRKSRLKELVKHCTDEELMELVLPRLAKAITLWEFLLMKVERGRPPKPHLIDMYHEYDALHKHMKRMCDNHLRPSTCEAGDPLANNQLQVNDEVLAHSLGLQIGTYDVHDKPLKAESPFQYTFLTADPTTVYMNENQQSKRTVQLVVPSELVSEPPPVSKAVQFDETPSTLPITEANRVVYMIGGVTATDPEQTTDDIAVKAESKVDAENVILQDGQVKDDEGIVAKEEGCSKEPTSLEGDISSQNILCVQAEPDTSQTVVLPEQQQQLTETMQMDETGELLVAPSSGDGGEMTQVYIEGEMAGELPADAQIFQTEDGLIVIQSPDGTIQIHSQNGQQIPMETVQALLAMDTDAQVETMETS